MDKITWISLASKRLQEPLVIGWTADVSDWYAAGLYEVRAVDWPDDPVAAVDDDLSYMDC